MRRPPHSRHLARAVRHGLIGGSRAVWPLSPALPELMGCVRAPRGIRAVRPGPDGGGCAVRQPLRSWHLARAVRLLFLRCWGSSYFEYSIPHYVFTMLARVVAQPRSLLCQEQRTHPPPRYALPRTAPLPPASGFRHAPTPPAPRPSPPPQRGLPHALPRRGARFTFGRKHGRVAGESINDAGGAA